MTRSISGTVSKARHKKVVALAKGYRGRSKNCFRVAIERVEKALSYAYRDRRNRKRDFRSLWIQRINAVVRSHGLVYSQFMHGLKIAGVKVNRKMLSEIAIHDPKAFEAIIHTAKDALSANKKAEDKNKEAI